MFIICTNPPQQIPCLCNSLGNEPDSDVPSDSMTIPKQQISNTPALAYEAMLIT